MFHSLRTPSRRLWLFVLVATASLMLSGLSFAQAGQNPFNAPG